MMFKHVGLIAFCLILCTSVLSYERGWRGIVPMRSTRADVEKLLGPSVEEGYGVTYDLGNEAVTFEYSSGPCTKGKKNGWNVPENTVIRIRVSSTEKPRFSDLKIDKKKFERIEDSELLDVLYYTNRAEGITYEVQDGVVTTVEYAPAAKDESLYCANRSG